MIEEILALFDRKTLPNFSSTRFNNGVERHEYWKDGPPVGIVDTNGKICIIRLYEVRHYYREGKFLRRVYAINDLGPGETIATRDELVRYYQHRHVHGMS